MVCGGGILGNCFVSTRAVPSWIIERTTKWIGNARGRPIENVQAGGVAFEAIRLDGSGCVNIITVHAGGHKLNLYVLLH